MAADPRCAAADAEMATGLGKSALGPLGPLGHLDLIHI